MQQTFVLNYYIVLVLLCLILCLFFQFSITMDVEMKIQTLRYDPVVKELVNLSNEVKDEKLKKRLEDIIDLRYKRDAYGVDFNTPATSVLQELLHATMSEDWESLMKKKEVLDHVTPAMVSGFWAGKSLIKQRNKLFVSSYVQMQVLH